MLNRILGLVALVLLAILVFQAAEMNRSLRRIEHEERRLIREPQGPSPRHFQQLESQHDVNAPGTPLLGSGRASRTAPRWATHATAPP